jgi:hypothetical protein
MIGELAGPTWVLRILTLAVAGLLIYAATLFRAATRAHLALLATGLILPILLIWLLARPDMDRVVSGRSFVSPMPHGTEMQGTSTASPSSPPSANALITPAADLSGRRLDSANLNGAVLARVKLTGASMRGATLRGADLTGADLQGADLTGADLSGACLDHANLMAAHVDNIVIAGASLEDARLPVGFPPIPDSSATPGSTALKHPCSP